MRITKTYSDVSWRAGSCAQMISLIYKGVEGLVLDLPASAAATHDLHGIILGQSEVGRQSS